jgi:hypothetical protein
MSLQTLLISVLITCVTVGVTFFYFRNRIQRTEQKVDLMFSLIQEHENNAKLRQQIPPIAMQGGMSSAALGQSQQHMPLQSQNELINISDDDDEEGSDSEYDSDDSAEVSDGDDDKIKIDSDDSNTNLEDTVKTISLTLEGAETSSSSDVNIQDIQNLEEHDISDESNQEDVAVDNSENLNDNFDAISTETVPSETPVQLKEVNDDDLDEIQLSDDEGDDEGEEDEDEDDEEVDDEQTKTVTVDTLDASTDYSKLTAKKLKEIAKEKGHDTKGLKKKQIVELLSSSQ